MGRCPSDERWIGYEAGHPADRQITARQINEQRTVRLRTRTIISCVITRDDLHIAVVRLGVELTRPNAVVLCRLTIPGFLQMEPALRRTELAPVTQCAGEASRVHLTVPSSWCALHPIGITGAQWDQARDEILRSIDRMLPLEPEDAEVGLIDLAGPDANPSDPAISGMLIGVARSRLEPWLTAMTEALGQPVESVRSGQMAALGLGLQHDERATVIEPDGSAHLLRWGRLTAIGELLDESASVEGRCIRLTNDRDDRDDRDDTEGGPFALAIASALADVVAPASFRPITGPAARRPRRWLAPAACAAIAMALLMLASFTGERRYQSAIAAQQWRQAQMSETLAETQRLRLETERLTRLLNEGVAATISHWEAITPALIEAQAAIPNDGTLHRLDLDRTSIALRGEAGNAGEALRSLEASAAFTGAAFTAPLSKSPDGADLFELRADRVSTNSGGASE